MRIMFMGQKFRCRTSSFLCIVFYLLFMATATGCSAASQDSKQGCADYFEVLEGVLGNPDIRKYGQENLASRNAAFLWEKLPSGIRECKSENGAITILRSSSSEFNRQREFIFIEKMYLDKDAAFVQFSFAPSGKNGDAFLRKRPDGWAVIQSYLWEN